MAWCLVGFYRCTTEVSVKRASISTAIALQGTLWHFLLYPWNCSSSPCCVQEHFWVVTWRGATYILAFFNLGIYLMVCSKRCIGCPGKAAFNHDTSWPSNWLPVLHYLSGLRHRVVWYFWCATFLRPEILFCFSRWSSGPFVDWVLLHTRINALEISLVETNENFPRLLLLSEILLLSSW